MRFNTRRVSVIGPKKMRVKNEIHKRRLRRMQQRNQDKCS